MLVRLRRVEQGAHAGAHLGEAATDLLQLLLLALLLVAVGGHAFPPPKAWTEHSGGDSALETTG
jgi:hypothetical protein